MIAALLPASAEAEFRAAELVTVTTGGFEATWTTTAPEDTTVCVARPGTPMRCSTQEAGVRFHHARVRGLKPGTRYLYELRSAGRVAPPSTTNPGSLTTLTPPPGRHLFDFALVSDVHIGEECSGTATTIGDQSLPPCFSAKEHGPYAARMAAAMVRELNRRHIPLVVLNADNTSHAEHGQAVRLRRILSRLNGEWHLARGAHDRVDQNDPDPRCGEDNDCFRAVLFPDREPGRIFYAFDHRGHHFVILDSADPESGQGDLTDPRQASFLRRELAEARRAGRRTFVAFHHPVSEHATTYAVPPLVFGVRADRGGAAFLGLMGRYSNAVGVLSAHTHRNFVSYSPSTGARLPYIENGPTKEYPGGYSVFRIYEGGYVRNFYRLRCSFCRRWTSVTRGEYYGLYPLYTLGTLAARNFTHLYDCPIPTPAPSLPGNEALVGGSVRC